MSHADGSKAGRRHPATSAAARASMSSFTKTWPEPVSIWPGEKILSASYACQLLAEVAMRCRAQHSQGWPVSWDNVKTLY